MTIVAAALINSFVASVLTTASIWLLLRLLPRRTLNSATRYWIWWAGIIIAILLPLFFVSFPVDEPAPTVLQSAPKVFASLPQTSPEPLTPMPSPPTSRASPYRFRMPAFPLDIPSERWPVWLLVVWSIVAVLLVIRLCASFLLLYRIRSRAFDLPGNFVQRIQHWAASSHTPRQTVMVKSSGDITTPVAIGPLHPCVLIPQALLTKLDADELTQVGFHEAAHFVRRDDYALVLQRGIEALFALNPVVRWIGSQLDLEREMACDDLVIASTGSPHSYARCLVRIVELSDGVRSSVAAVPATADRSHLARRIDVLLDKTRHAGTRLLKFRLIAIIAGMAALALAAGRISDVIAFSRPYVAHPARISVPKFAKITFLPQQAADGVKPIQGVAGRVLEDSSGNPLASAELRFHKSGMYELAADLETDRHGRFTAPDLPPGDYTVDAQKPNYIGTTFKLHIPSGSPLIRLVRYGVIDGQAMDSQGKPLPSRIHEPTGRTRGSTRITVLTRHPGTDELQLFREIPLEDDGHYRIFDLPPGEYAVGMWYSGLNDGSGMQLYPDNSHPRFFSVSGGEEYNNINFLIAPRPAWNVSGKIVLPEGVKGQFQLALGLPEQPMLPVSQTLSERDGSFTFEKIPAGNYDLFAAGPTSGYGAYESVLGPGEHFFGRSRISDSAQNLEGLSITVASGQQLKIRLKAAGVERVPEGCSSKAEISLAPLDPWAVIFSTSLVVVEFGKEQTIANVAPGRFRLFANELGSSCYQPTTPIVDLTSGTAEPVAVEIASAGSIQGKVRNGVGAVAVVLFPAASSGKTEARVAFPDADGNFVFETLPPGPYRIIVRPSAEPRARWVSSQGGREIDVLAGKPTSVDVDATEEPHQ